MENRKVRSRGLKPLDIRPQYLQIADEIKEEILIGKMAIGDKLPPEREMAKYYDVGRPTIREAVRSLEILGLLETQRGKGTFVANNTQKVLLTSLNIISNVNEVSTKEIIEYREMFELTTVALAATNRTEGELKKSEEIIESFKVSSTFKEVEETDLLFHKHIAQMSHNILIIKTFSAMRSFFDQIIKTSAYKIPLDGKTYQDISYFHLPIYEAIRDRDPEVAKLFMKRHMDKVRDLARVEKNLNL